jgi:hypothetical protein
MNVSNEIFKTNARVTRTTSILVFTVSVTVLSAHAQVTGRIAGTVTDQSKGIVSEAKITLQNPATGVKQSLTTDRGGNYAFPAVAVGRYEIEIAAPGFKSFKSADIVINIGSSAQIDATLELAQESQTVNVSEEGSHVETSDTQLGQVITSKQITDVPLNGRSFTDLFAIQGGVTPLTTSGATNSSSGGGFGTVPVAGNGNTGQFSIHGQRESANGFFLNGASVQETIGQQAGIIPNLDSIAEFRIITSNADAEYGNYSGGLIDVVTKSGGNLFHGSLFEFLRNTDFDSRGFFSPERSTFQQNQFGGTVGGPIRKNKIFFYGDYQGQRTIQGLETGLITVPSLANRTGNFQDNSASLTGTVNGDYLAQTLSSRLGYTVSQGESFYKPGCNTSLDCVFPNAMIPQRAFSTPSTKLLQYIPSPNVGANQFSSGAEKLRLNDGKGSGRIDANTTKYGNFYGYYFIDRYNLDNPYPSGFGGATVPGYDALSRGQDQLIVLSNTKTFGATAVNEARISFTRLNNNLGTPKGGVGVSLADQGFSTGGSGIKQGFPKYAGVETLYFNNFTVGTNPFFVAQVNNTYQASDNFSKVMGTHTMKFGGQYTRFRVKQAPDLVANGTFSFFGTGQQSTGSDFADFLLGLPDFYSQQSSPAFYERSSIAGVFAQDSWRIRPNLTLNYGLRWDYIGYWSEQWNQTTALVAGRQSVTFPGAPLGYLVPGDPGIPPTIAPTRLNDFSPRLGLAYSPGFTDGLLGKLTGGPGKSSVRLSAGRFFTSVEGLTVAYPTGNPPYGLTYTSPESPQFDQPFIGSLTGTHYIQQFPVQVPPYGTSPNHPDPNVDWSRYEPISGAGSPFFKNKTPYSMTLNFTLERQISQGTLASASCIGSLGRHLLTITEANPGNPALCLSLSQPQDVAPGTPTCGPFGENQVYTRANGQIVTGTRSPFPNQIGTNGSYATMGNSHYHGLELTLKRTRGPLTLLASYTFSKSMDWASNIQEQVDPYNYRKLAGISAFDIKHNFVISYDYDLRLEKVLRTNKYLTKGWSISGITRLATGLPVTFASFGDNYLVQAQNNGINSVSIDVPDVTPGPLKINHDPRNGLPAFNTSLFQPNALGTPGTSSRRFFYGPGVENFDMVLRKLTQFNESRSLELRFETFNTFNHAQFFGNGSVDGNINSPTFGRVLHAAPPRIVQLGAKFTF